MMKVSVNDSVGELMREVRFDTAAKLARISLTCVFGLTLLTLSACSSRPKTDFSSYQDLHARIMAYENSLPDNHPHQIENLFVVSDDVLKQIRDQFGDGSRHRRARELAMWLIAPDGHGMVYDVNANLTPDQAFQQKRGNCLSFTVLLVTLANDLGIHLKYNDVDLPSTWAMDEQTGMVFYRHINAIFETSHQKQVFDLAMNEYDAVYPQRFIEERTAGALLHSNLGIQSLAKKQFDQALHHLKLAVSIAPQRADLWINLGVAFKRHGELAHAEYAFQIAFDLRDRNGLAASNLERLYREQGRDKLADRYQKLAAKARLQNPYVQYRLAKEFYQDKQYLAAKKAVRRAIKLHDLDPSFYELSSVINQRFRRYGDALKDLEKAFNLTVDAVERGRYFSKVQTVARRAEQEASEKKQRQQRNQRRIELLDYTPSTF